MIQLDALKQAMIAIGAKNNCSNVEISSRLTPELIAYLIIPS